MERQQDYVLRSVEERGIRFIRLWFTDVLGQLKSIAIVPGELENAFEEGMTFDGSADRRLQPGAGERHAPPARPQHLRAAAVAGRRRARRPHVLRRHQPRRRPLRRRPPPRPAPQLDRAREKGFSFYVGPDMEFFYFAQGDGRPPADTPSTPARYFDLTTVDVATDLRRRTILGLESIGIPVRYSHHEDSPSQHEIDLRYTDALTMADNVMTFKLVVKEIALRAGRPRHASCPSRWPACRARACTPTSRSSRATSTPSTTRATRPTCRRWPRASSPGCCTTPGRSPPSPTSGSTPTSGWWSGFEAPVVRGLGPQQPLGPGAGARVQAEQAGVDPHRVPLARPGLQPLPGLRRHPGRRPQGHRGVLRAARRAHRQPLRDDRRGAPGRGRRGPARLARRGGRRAWSSPSCVRRGPRRARLRVVHPQQAGRVGRLQDPGHPVRARPVPRTSEPRRWNRSSSFPTRRRRRWPRPSTGPATRGGPATTSDEATRLEPEDGWAGRPRLRRRRPRGRLRHVPPPAQARHPPRAAAPRRPHRPAGRPRAARGPVRRLLPRSRSQPGELEARLKHLFWRTGTGHPARS